MMRRGPGGGPPVPGTGDAATFATPQERPGRVLGWLPITVSRLDDKGGTRMRETRSLKKGLRLALLAAAVLLAGCGGGIKGTYADHNGLVSIKFESGKAYMKTPGGTLQIDYEVDGDHVLLKTPQGNLVLNRQDDGSLSSPWGRMKKTGS